MKDAGRDTRATLVAGILLGIGLMAAIDEIVFHQLLGWHHFFDRATPAIGLLSDGLLHSAELIILVAGFFMLARLRERQAWARGLGLAGLFLGAGGFQLFDGIVDHKLLRVHQVRYVDNLIVYDIAWNAGAILLIVTGWLLLRHARASHPA